MGAQGEPSSRKPQFTCPGCNQWQQPVPHRIDDDDDIHAAFWTAMYAHRDTCPRLALIEEIETWYIALDPTEDALMPILEERLAPIEVLCEWVHHQHPDGTVDLIAACNACGWQIDGPTHPDLNDDDATRVAILETIYEHRHDCEAFAVMAALRLGGSEWSGS